MCICDLWHLLFLHLLYACKHLEYSRWKFLLLEAKIGLTGSTYGATKGAALDEMVDEPQRVEAMTACQLGAFVIWLHGIENNIARAVFVTQWKGALVYGSQAQRAHFIL